MGGSWTLGCMGTRPRLARGGGNFLSECGFSVEEPESFAPVGSFVVSPASALASAGSSLAFTPPIDSGLTCLAAKPSLLLGDGAMGTSNPGGSRRRRAFAKGASSLVGDAGLLLAPLDGKGLGLIAPLGWLLRAAGRVSEGGGVLTDPAGFQDCRLLRDVDRGPAGERGDFGAAGEDGWLLRRGCGEAERLDSMRFLGENAGREETLSRDAPAGFQAGILEVPVAMPGDRDGAGSASGDAGGR